MTSMSGINISDECKDRFDEMKLGHKYSYIVYKMDSGFKNVVVDSVGEKGATFEDLRTKLKSAVKEGRYAVYDCQYAEHKSKLVFIMWVDEFNIPVRQKMVYSATKAALKSKLQIELEVQCNDDSDLTFEHLAEKCKDRYE